MSTQSGIDEFVTACGGSLPLRVRLTRPGGEEQDYGLPARPFLFVGRSDECDLVLDGAEISQRHAYVQFVGGRIFCADLGSRAGIQWPYGSRSADWVELEERLSLGRFQMQFAVEGNGEAAAAFERASQATQNRPDVELRFLNASVGEQKSKAWALRHTVTLLGHLRTCHVPLRHQSVSRVHASVIHTRNGLWVVDLMGREGIRVNGDRVPFARLEESDILEIGMFRMAVEFASTEFAGAQHPGTDLSTEVRPARAFYHRGPADMVPWQDASHVPQQPAPQPASQPGAPSSGGGLSEQFVMSLLNHSAMMQKQMLDQQNQMMLMMMQMLSSMHTQHLDMVRDEMQHVRELTREIQEVQSQLHAMKAGATGSATQSESSPIWDAAVTEPSGSVSPAGLLDERSGVDEKPPFSSEQPKSQKPDSSDAERDRARQRMSDEAHRVLDEAMTSPLHETEDDQLWEQVELPPHSEPQPRAQKRPAQTPQQERTRNRNASRKSTGQPSGHRQRKSPQPQNATDRPNDAELHAQLTQRLAELERKRNSYWQKIMSVISGAG